jgi:hypothetical protein
LSSDAPPRDHLFLSFAPEDWALAEWLTLRLTREGYRMWCSRFPVLGGERYPSRTDEAITARAFRVLALASRASLSSPVTTKEMTLAAELGRRRAENFVIQLLTDDVDENGAISFRERWEDGLAHLLTTLDAVAAPRALLDGERVANEARQFLASRRSWHTVL